MQISRFYTKNKYIYVICKTLPVTAVNRILLAFYCCWNRAHLWKTALKQNIDFEGLNTWHRGNRKSLWYLLWREFVARTQKSGLFQEPLPRALFDLPWRSWVGSDLNNKAAPCTADESSSFIVGLAATAAGKRRRNEPGTQSQKLWLGPGCVALSGRRDGRLSASENHHPDLATWLATFKLWIRVLLKPVCSPSALANPHSLISKAKATPM